MSVIASLISTNNCNSSATMIHPQMRQHIAIQSLGDASVTDLANAFNTSRKFIYTQKDKAAKALNAAFSPKEPSDEQVLFYLPVTKAWLYQLALALILICHSSYQGVIELFRDLFDFHICKGTIHNITRAALSRASAINSKEDLSNIKIGIHDEIFQGTNPVLVGCDAKSTYNYLLSMEESRDGTTWGVHLLDLEKRGLRPDFTIADGGTGLRSGQKEAWPNIPCRSDVFHAEKDMGDLSIYLENRALGAINAVAVLERKMEKAKKRSQGTKYSKKLACARAATQRAIELADDVRILKQWLQEDILAVVGPQAAIRRKLLDFIVQELAAREAQCPHRISPVRKFLEGQRDDLLHFVATIDEQLSDLAEDLGVGSHLVRAVFELQSIPTASQKRWKGMYELQTCLGRNFYLIEAAVQEIIRETVRASSLVENLNSRLRNYFFLRKQLGSEYLDLLRFFLNHRRFMRSSRLERVNKSPAELLTGEKHPHWLELLGFKLFRRANNQSAAVKKAA